ncbi:MAG: nucleotide pyrophosphatase [Symploca sp. SIO2B6]|nr:nucleotide pyrophosphatase [Symploca sp. SIO2B6]
MKTPVIAIGLDAADPVLLENWMSQGHLQNLKQLRKQGAYGRLTNLEHYKAETPWTTFLTGCLPSQTGYWAPIKFHEGTYEATLVEAYNFKEYSPFYALGDDYRVAVFDIPQSSLSEQVNGSQVLAWGAHSPQTPTHSLPAQLLSDLISKHGEHPALHKDHGDWWDLDYLQHLKQALETGIEQRSAICRDFLRQEQWDLFLTIFGETHSAGHDFWFLSQPEHPLYHHHKLNGFSSDPMLEVFESVDRAVGEIIAEAPKNAYVIVFAVHGSGSNTTDVTSMLFLPEFLYRFSFPGKSMLPIGKLGVPPLAPIVTPKTMNWQAEVWRQIYHPNPLITWLRRWGPEKLNQKLEPWLPRLAKLTGANYSILSRLRRPGGGMSWQPPMWYQPLWSQMKAFALPSFSEGYVRINLQGREPNGIVARAEYDALCDELTQQIYSLKNARTGTPMVKKVIRTRLSGSECDPKLPDADLVVIWEDSPADVIESPQFGRIGPVPYRRTGSHRARGFLSAIGPGIEPGSHLPTAPAVDLTPTILQLMDAPIPKYFDGKPLLKKAILAR